VPFCKEADSIVDDHSTNLVNDNTTYRVVSIERHPKQRGRYLVHLDGAVGPAALNVHEDTLVRFRLVRDALLDAAELARIEAADGKHRAYAAALGYLGAKPRTRKEIERYLARKELDEQAIQETADRLERERYIDDTDYAQAFAKQRAGHAKGRLLIKQELQQRGIDRQAAAEAIASLDPEAESLAAVTLASKKWKLLKGEPNERRHKLAQFLMRRGYTGEIVRDAIRAVSQDDESLEDVTWLDN
jgi:regulatory protein